MTEIDYYELLECERTADAATIKSSYRKLAMKYHPDKNAGCKDSEAKFKAVSEAYDCLKDPQKRAAYDRFGHAAFRNGGMGGGGHGHGAQDFAGFSDIFESVFGEFMGGQRGGGAPDARRLRQLPRHRIETGHPRAHLPPLPGRRKGPRAAGFLRGRTRLPGLPRLGRGHHRSVPRLPRRGPRGEDQDAQRQRAAGRR